MRIGIDVSVLAQPQPAGVATIAEDFATAMVKKLNREVVIFAFFPRGYLNLLQQRRRLFWSKAEVRWWAVPARLFRMLTTVWQHCPWIPVELWTGKLNAAINIDGYQLPSRAPSIFWINDLTTRKFPQWHTIENITLQNQRLNTISKRGNLVVCLSQSTASDFRHYYPNFKGEVMVIYPDIAPRFQHLPKIQVEAELDKRWQLKRNYFLAVGTIEPRKNMNGLYNAYKKLSKEIRRKHTLVIAGKPGWQQASLIKTLRTDPEIKWLGQVDRDRLPVLYNGALGFCYPSFYEGFGLPVLEALRCGCPVLTSRVSSLPEVGGEAAFYCDPQDTDSIYNGLLRLTKLTDKERHDRMLAGYNQAAQFNYQKGIEQLLAWVNQS